ncbi:hypothetical protein GCM10011491_16370 [Brucella endophytica]|uniref:Uncharacterized protein n=1 Tax=Brucella endophytica TaxID=1963359 RepID=A0A916WDQ9_9HYPH|nr:hypothetical protein [Brucella endophytica]GGA89232.1 hypothetical protein GCM10011491_16370 [Brucella endophytica]
MGVTIKHYRASKLPAELRMGLPDDALVRVTVEPEPETRGPRNAKELEEQIERVRKTLKRTVTTEEAVARIRELRDEWDD